MSRRPPGSAPLPDPDDNEEYKRGYGKGYVEGKDAGSKEGKEAGIKEGKETGIKEGKEAGIKEGKDAGYKEGKDTGYKEGKDAGYKEGVKASEEASAKTGPTTGSGAGSLQNQQEEFSEEVTSGEISAHNTHIADYNLPDDHIVSMPRDYLYRVEFQQAYKCNPRLLVGLSVFRDNEKSPSVGHAVEVAKVDQQGCELRIYNHMQSISNTLGASWMAIPHSTKQLVHFESGITDIHGGSPDKNTSEAGETITFTKQARFSRPFSSAPKFACWFTDLAQKSQDKDKPHVHELSVEAAGDTSLSGRGILFKSADARFNYSRIGWLAWDAESDNTKVKTGWFSVDNEHWSPDKTITFQGKPFTKRPSVFAAVSRLACGQGERPYVGCWLSSITMNDFKVTYGAPLTSYKVEVTFRWVAIGI